MPDIHVSILGGGGTNTVPSNSSVPTTPISVVGDRTGWVRIRIAADNSHPDAGDLYEGNIQFLGRRDGNTLRITHVVVQEQGGGGNHSLISVAPTVVRLNNDNSIILDDQTREALSSRARDMFARLRDRNPRMLFQGPQSEEPLFGGMERGTQDAPAANFAILGNAGLRDTPSQGAVHARDHIGTGRTGDTYRTSWIRVAMERRPGHGAASPLQIGHVYLEGQMDDRNRFLATHVVFHDANGARHPIYLDASARRFELNANGNIDLTNDNRIRGDLESVINSGLDRRLRQEHRASRMVMEDSLLPPSVTGGVEVSQLPSAAQPTPGMATTKAQPDRSRPT